MTNPLYRSFGYYASQPSTVLVSSDRGAFDGLNSVSIREAPGGRVYHKAGNGWLRFFSKNPPVYHALLPHMTFEGKSIEPIWTSPLGGAVIAWHVSNGERRLLVGLDVVEEIIRHCQGDPSKISGTQDKSGYGFSFERPNYMFNDQVHKEYPTHPWADYLGFFLAETFSQITGFPLIEPLPFGARGAVILTGDDDQALLERYQMQLDLIGDLPITYFLHHLTNHTPETLAAFPAMVELGLHPDALDEPARYDERCSEQGIKMNSLTGRQLRVVRNHGFLSQGYLGHLPVWEAIGLELDSNYPGVEGIALNASFLPLPVRKLDGTWTSHYSLLTLFGDGMVEPYGPNLSIRAAVARINQLARQIEQTHPGMMVFNLHPQNIIKTRELHQAVMKIARRPGWTALGLDSLLERLKILQHLKIEKIKEHHYSVEIPQPLEGVTLRYPITGARWKRKTLAPWSGRMELELS